MHVLGCMFKQCIYCHLNSYLAWSETEMIHGVHRDQILITQQHLGSWGSVVYDRVSYLFVVLYLYYVRMAKTSSKVKSS